MVAQEQVLEHEVLAVTEEANGDSEQEPKQFKHADSIQDRRPGS